jgi:protein-L-isoaspartate(D-aspartate) O-methyltransferase
MNDDRLEERLQMVDIQLKSRARFSEEVLQAMREIPRHLFVPVEFQNSAYSDGPLPIEHGQTISQPFIVGLMASLLTLKKTDKVLELGLGSGYSAAVLSRLASRVYAVDREESFLGLAAEKFKSLGIGNVELKSGDGTLGWPEEAPFDAISVTAGAPGIPQPLLDQLKIGGVLVIPVGNKEEQTLVQVIKKGPRHFEEKKWGGVRFVPLIGKEAWLE